MIGLLLRLPLALAVLVPLTWGVVLLEAGDANSIFDRSSSDLEAAYPSRVDQLALLGKARRVASALETRVPELGGDRARLIHVGLVASALHGGAALGILPVTFLLALSGVCTGLAFRERMRMGSGYASPTAAGLGKGAVGAGILWLVLFGLSPVPVSLAWVYLAPGAIALGGTLYVANLPLKL